MFIYDRNMQIIQRSRNLAGIRRYVSNHLITRLSIADSANGEANLHIEFDNGATFLTRFADGSVLRDWVRRWRNVYGAPLFINGQDRGKVDAHTLALATGGRS